MLSDAHCHLHEFPVEEREGFRGMLIAAVSEDVQSSRATMELAREDDLFLPFVGIHPWNAGLARDEDLAELEGLVPEAAGLGEIGIDNRYHADEWERQRSVFRAQLRMAVEYDKPVNLHCLDAWRECLDEVLRSDVRSAAFHWYNGPLDLLEEVASAGLFVSVNVAMKVQRKHLEIAEAVPLDILLLESDGPYEYRGLRLTPAMIGEALGPLASIRRIGAGALESTVHDNFLRAFSGRPGH